MSEHPTLDSGLDVGPPPRDPAAVERLIEAAKELVRQNRNAFCGDYDDEDTRDAVSDTIAALAALQAPEPSP